ncbi:MAG: hypothetical protein K9J37_14735 [Saprospiraceae bacterium]|nr:hypothetical protein [Saprospiraceae bacterium]MCF8251164.1 hypothetical protein [Saprospiraceae bacterium]MCF8281887.1 hypothetical protein [Bacteroidales bacterium]MCF8312976.1 hypothetical protein [Saprospiraceae bacterium]MCF8441423.1 hypothetical protein [Saprospiraceae bacterium]
MKKHGNSNENNADHHLYEIFDLERSNTYKYGICGDPLNKDGSSPRGKTQAKEFNRAFGWLRFLVRILLTGIPGRREAKRIETEYMEAYREKWGEYPPGNQ